LDTCPSVQNSLSVTAPVSASYIIIIFSYLSTPHPCVEKLRANLDFKDLSGEIKEDYSLYHEHFSKNS